MGAHTLESLALRVVACRACPRLVAYREAVARQKRRQFRHEDYWGRAVPGFGDPGASVLVVGLAPAAHGANRTGRMFTGDGAGAFLIASLHRAGLASHPNPRHRDDGLALQGVYLTAVVRCAPPANRPTAQELRNCRPYLVEELRALKGVRVVVTLGRVATQGFLSALREMGHRPPPVAFGHGRVHRLGPGLPLLVTSYHPSRQNTQTGRLTPPMLDAVWRTALSLARGEGGG